GKKSAMTMVSLSLAGIIFMCAATFISSIDEEEFSRQGWFEYGEYTLEFSSNAAQVDEFGYTGLKKKNPLNDELIQEIQGIPEVSDVMELKDLEVAYTYNGESSEQDLAAPFTKDEAELMKSYVKNGQLDYEKMVKNKEVFIAHNDIAKEIFGWKFEVGDKVILKWYDGEKYVEDEFTIAGDLKKNINNPEVNKLAYNAGWFLIPEELLQSMMLPGFNLNKRLVIASSDYEASKNVLDEKLSIIADSSPIISISKLSDRIEHNKEQFGLIYSTTLGAAIFVIAFSLINLLNTLITNVMARKREFACFRTLGMSEKQVATMIRGEGLYFALVNMLTTVILGSASGFIMVKLMAYSGLNYMKYQLPLGYLAVYIAMVVVVPVLISNIAIKILSKKSLIDRLKEIE
ncbi:MAG: ABC transporter permease, partial [Clostridium sp.]